MNNTYLATNCQCIEKAMVDACPVHDRGEAPVFAAPADRDPELCMTARA